MSGGSDEGLCPFRCNLIIESKSFSSKAPPTSMAILAEHVVVGLSSGYVEFYAIINSDSKKPGTIFKCKKNTPGSILKK